MGISCRPSLAPANTGKSKTKKRAILLKISTLAGLKLILIFDIIVIAQKCLYYKDQNKLQNRSGSCIFRIGRIRDSLVVDLASPRPKQPYVSNVAENIQDDDCNKINENYSSDVLCVFEKQDEEK